MRIVLRLAILAALVLQGVRAVNLAKFDDLMNTAEGLYDEGDGEGAVDYVQRAMEVRRTQASYVWLGDTASYVYRHPPKGGWSDEDTAALIGLAWEGYAGAVIRCPVDSWSWSGVADAALTAARRADHEASLSLDELDRRSQGVLNGRFAVAVAAAQLAAQLQPSGYQQLDVLARVYEFTGELDKARDTYALSARMMPAPSFHVWGSGRRLLQELYAVILTNLDAGLSAAPPFEASMLHLDVARFARAQGDAATAFEHLAVAKRTAPDDYWKFEVSRELASLYEEQGKFPEAVAELSVVLRTGFGRAEAYRKSASLHARLQQFDEACAQFRLAVRDEQGDAGLRAEASRACEASGDLASAEQFLNDGIKNPATDLLLARALIEFYHRHDKDRTADSTLAGWARDFPDSPELQKWRQETAGARP